MKFFNIFFSILLSLGLLSDKYFPFVKESIIIVILLSLFINKQRVNVLIINMFKAWPLFVIFVIFLVLGTFLPYRTEGGSAINSKFLVAILIYIILSTFFSLNAQYVKHSLIFFGVGAGILSILYSLNFFGAEFYDIRNDRLFFLNENPNSLSVRISLGILFLLWGSVENVLKASKLIRYSLLIPIPFMFNLILASGSKGSFIICIVSPLIYILFLKNISKKVKRSIIFSIIITLILTTSIFLNSTLYLRFMGDDLSSGRSEIWEAALKIFEMNPFGVGEMGYSVEIFNYLKRVIDTHNLFIYLLVTGGFISLVLFTIFLLKIFKNVIIEYKKSKNVINIIIFISIIFIMSKTGGVLTYLIMWYFLACLSVQPIRRTLNFQST